MKSRTATVENSIKSNWLAPSDSNSIRTVADDIAGRNATCNGEGRKKDMNEFAKKLLRSVGQHWPWPVQAKLKDGQRLYVDLRSAVGRGIYMKGEFDPAVFHAISPSLCEGGRFLDVGANAGIYSVLAIDKVGPSGMVDAFEIDDRSLRCLRKTKKRFSLDPLQIHPVAIGSQNGTTYLMKETECGNSYCGEDEQGSPVPMKTLDSWAQETGIESIAAKKIYVEGLELDVLSGAEHVLDSLRPTIVLEAEESLQQRGGGNVAELKNTLHRFGYSTRVVDGCLTPTLLATPTSASA